MSGETVTYEVTVRADDLKEWWKHHTDQDLRDKSFRVDGLPCPVLRLTAVEVEASAKAELKRRGATQ